MAFSFGFGEDAADSDNAPGVTKQETQSLVPVQEHDLAALVATLPSHLSYSTVRIESPTGKEVFLPKRDIYDVRVQLLQEGSTENDHVIDQLENSDIREGIYEGGFKTWECSLDLASLLLDRGPRKDIDELVRCERIIELGCGSALPTLVLFQHAVCNDIPLAFTLADYNAFVLRYLTLPNLLLTWASTTAHLSLTATSTGDLDLTPEILAEFTAALHSKQMSLQFLSGPWCPDLASHIPHDQGTLILAAETIYSPASTIAFVDLITEILRRTKMAKAVIGAKRMYFGVGGSVDGLKAACRDRGAVAYEVENHGVPGMDGVGVGRALVEVQMF